MITIGIANAKVLNTGVVNHLQSIYEETGAKVEVILDPYNGFYYKNKRIGFRKYHRKLKENYTDILIIMFNKENFINNRTKKIPLDIMVITSDVLTEINKSNSKLYKNKIVNKIKEQPCTILPIGFGDKSKLISSKNQLITYGIGRNAIISASSVEEDVGGDYLLQCCIKDTIETIQGKTIEQQEFSVKADQKDIDMTLVGVATLLLYGIDCEDILRENKKLTTETTSK